jgi:DNA polymerase
MTAEEIQKLNQEIHSCQKCPLGATRTNAVPGQGNLNAKVMFIGEAPGATEDAQGIPFCGKAGGVLDELLAIAGLKREEIFIGNILKCRPPNNRNPQEIEIKTCTPYLDRQIELIKPSVLCCLGNFSTAYIMRKIFLSDVAYGKIKIMPLFHPAVVTYDMSKKSVLAEDFRLLKNIPK